jgi:hypothetical protein
MSSVVIAGNTSGTITLDAPNVAGTTVLTLPTANGTVLTTANITSNLPTGSVVQVVNATYATQTTSTSNTLADTGLQAIITPSSSSNKILVMYTVPVAKNSGDNSNGISFGMTRNGTSFGNAEWLAYGAWTGSSVNNRAGYSNMLLDTPSSTSALTYKLRFCETYGSVGVTICHDGSYATMTLMEIKG